jgi:hypothetical protein
VTRPATRPTTVSAAQPGYSPPRTPRQLRNPGFEVGLFGWMALMAFVFFPNPHLMPTSPVFWFLMQIGMIVGYFTSWPANVWLIRRGIKQAM